ncbi:MAG TPA: DNA polymerase III subunit beta [Thermodesulfobacteriota bacterium]|nr:DNA polymerase III subunit beta [Thermodesulfobacteriota bacterium]
MEFTIDQSQLVRGLARTQSIVERRSTMPILANVLLAARAGEEGGAAAAGPGYVEFAATDLEVGVRTRVPAEVRVPGSVTVNAKKLYEVARELPAGPIRVAAREGAAELSAGKVVISLVGLPPEEFPALPAEAEASFAALDLEAVRGMIEQTLYAASSDETRYNLNGVFFERVETEGAAVARMVATDGHRLALADRAVAGGLEALRRGVILPRKGVQELKRLLDEAAGSGQGEELRVAFRENSGLFRVDGTLLVMRLIEGAFPDYRQVIPRATDGAARVEREAFARALRRVSIVSAEKSRGVKLVLAPGVLEVSTANPDLGEAKEELDLDYRGRRLVIGFNARYLLEFLATIRAETVLLDLQDEVSPGLFRGLGEEGVLGVVMPMRI